MKIKLFIFLLLISLSYSFLPDSTFQFLKFKQQFNKQYTSSTEHTQSMQNFQNNIKHILDHQQNQHQQSAYFGHTKFSDLTPEQFSSKYLNLNKKLAQGSLPNLKNEKKLKLAASQGNENVPEQFDWRDKNVVTEAKFQNTCGSCWTFSTTGVIESQYAIKYGKLLRFSEQQLVDCDDINDGCHGGLMTDAYQYLQNAGGLETEEDYGKYVNKKQQCKFDQKKVKAKIQQWYKIDQDEEQIKNELYKNGPIAAGVNARLLQFYQGGVLDPKECNSDINHAVLIVGYGVEENGQKYWIIKNQWGKDWGLNGYFKLARGKQQCGIHTYASIAFIE